MPTKKHVYVYTDLQGDKKSVAWHGFCTIGLIFYFVCVVVVVLSYFIWRATLIKQSAVTYVCIDVLKLLIHYCSILTIQLLVHSYSF